MDNTLMVICLLIGVVWAPPPNNCNRTICSDCRSNDCYACIDGYFLKGDHCDPCKVPCKTCDKKKDNCTSCTSEHFLDKSSNCVACDSQCNCESPGGQCVSLIETSTVPSGIDSTSKYSTTTPSSSSSSSSSLSLTTTTTTTTIRTRTSSTTSPSSSPERQGQGAKKQPITNSERAGPLAGGLVGAVIVVIVVGVTFGVIWKRRRRKMKQEGNAIAEKDSLSHLSNVVTENEALYSVPNKVKAGGVKKKDNVKSEHVVPTYENTIIESDVPAVPPKIYAYLDDDLMEEIHDEDTDPTGGLVEGIYDVYYNTSGLFRRRIAVDKLSECVAQKSDVDFEAEFQKLADGLTRNYQEAIKKKNIKKNRYSKVYPYDATRVALRHGGGDYINASYIDGYKRNHAYIAALGPTYTHGEKFSLFWRMVWQENVDTIVVLTKLKEGEKMKFGKYWPDQGQRQTYGSVSVQTLSEECYAELTIRTFTITKGTRQKTVHQAHYTAWPDHGVPDNVASLLEFRRKVRALPNQLGGPLVVHCSAGIGRTGTYIALDILIQEGLGERSVDVYGCVNGLRGQRVNMVQNVDQYRYLHHALVHALTVDTGHAPSDKIARCISSSGSSA